MIHYSYDATVATVTTLILPSWVRGVKGLGF